jgi:hypothetical protein
MKIALGIVLIILVFFLLIKIALGGLAVFTGSVELSPFEEKTVCGVCIYSTLPQKGRFTLEFSKDLEKFVSKIYPNDFELQPIQCPSEPEARRACISAECANPNSVSAKSVCVSFKGPFELALFPKKTEYRGAIRSVEKIGAAVIVLPVDFVVFYTPFNAWLIVIPLIAACIFVGIFSVKKLRKRKLKRVRKK